MSTARRCDHCGTAYIAQRSDSKYCSSTCRVKANANKAKAGPTPAKGGTLEATEATLTAADRLNDPNSQAALVLARRIDQNTDSGAGMAALVKELRATLQAALANAAGAGDSVDEVQRRRDAKRARAAAG